jgi:hypothetical protein
MHVVQLQQGFVAATCGVTAERGFFDSFVNHRAVSTTSETVPGR